MTWGQDHPLDGSHGANPQDCTLSSLLRVLHSPGCLVTTSQVESEGVSRRKGDQEAVAGRPDSEAENRPRAATNQKGSGTKVSNLLPASSYFCQKPAPET